MHRLLTHAQLAILREVNFFGFLTTSRLARLRYEGSENYAGEMLKRLFEGGYLHRQFSPPDLTRNPPPRTEYAYWLSAKGARCLREAGTPARVPAPRAHTFLFLDHLFAVNDFFIAARSLERHTQGVELVALEHERELKRRPYIAAGKAVSPDGFVHFRVNGRDFPVVLEVDRGTEDREQWQEKVRRLSDFIKDGSGYERRYRTQSVTVAVVVHLPDEDDPAERAGRLFGWTQDVLARLRRRGDVFQFTHHRPDRVPPDRFFFAPHWQVPFFEEEFALLEL